MTTDTVRAFDLIWRHWQAGTVLDALPPELTPHTRAEAYAIQAHLEGRSRKPPAGWKIAATSSAGQQRVQHALAGLHLQVQGDGALRAVVNDVVVGGSL